AGAAGAGGWSEEQRAPDLFAGRKLRKIAALGVFVPERHHRRAAHPLADLERLRQLAVDALFLLPDHALDRSRATAAIFLRPVQAGPAAICLLLLPGLADLDHVVLGKANAPERRLRELGLEFLPRVGIDPLAGGVAEFGFLRRVVEIHGEPLNRCSVSVPHGEEAL